MINVNAVRKALEPYGYTDITTVYPLGFRPRKDIWALDIRMKIYDATVPGDAQALRHNLLFKFEEAWEILTGRFGLRLQSHPSFEICGQLEYDDRSRRTEPRPCAVYAEARFDLWVP